MLCVHKCLQFAATGGSDNFAASYFTATFVPTLLRVPKMKLLQPGCSNLTCAFLYVARSHCKLVSRSPKLIAAIIFPFIRAIRLRILLLIQLQYSANVSSQSLSRLDP